VSAHFAIPATTFVLRSVINARLKAAYGGITPPKVSVSPPPRPGPPGNGAQPPEPPGLILYMHHAGPNPAWRNMYDPHVNSEGARVANAPLVLDLQYMLAAQGDDLEREAVLGIGMSAFHRNGILSRKIVHDILHAVNVPNPATKFMDKLSKEPLDQQFESITVSQQPVDIDMSTKLWSALQSPARPCTFYLVTTVFLDTGDPDADVKLIDSIGIATRPVVDPAADPAEDEVFVA